MSARNKTVGVAMGGLSSEREVSLRSGRAVVDALRQAGWQALPLEVDRETAEEVARLIDAASADVVFVAMHGGFGEDGRLQKVLTDLGVPFTGPAEKASRLAMDKAASRALFEKEGLCVPATRVIRRGRRMMSLLHDLRYPVVVKPACQGSSIGVTRVTAGGELSAAVMEAQRHDDIILVEEFIEGQEVTVSVLDGAALPVVAVVPPRGFFDFRAKYEKGLTQYLVPAPLDAAVAARAQRDAVRAYDALGCRHLARVDMIIDVAGRPVILEVNTVPGFTETSLFPKAAQAAGMAFPVLCDTIVRMALNAGAGTLATPVK
ncbi:MAG: D-alanine--D-alanine ligase family protein [Deltaproteobacteria bacterium]